MREVTKARGNALLGAFCLAALGVGVGVVCIGGLFGLGIAGVALLTTVGLYWVLATTYLNYMKDVGILDEQ